MKKYILIMLLVIFSLTAITATATSTATINYQLDQQGSTVTNIVKGVPFFVDVQMSVSSDNTNNNVRDMTLHTMGQGFAPNEPVFIRGIRGAWLPNAGNPDQNKLLDGNVWQYLFTAGHGTVDTSKNEFKNILKLEVSATSSGQITVDNSKTNSIGGNVESFTIQPVTSMTISPINSECGDGVVGYIDGNTPGIKDGNDVNEACDTLLPGATGCSSDCSYIKATHRITGTRSLTEKNKCDFGSRTCALEVLEAKPLFLAKLNAIFNIPDDISASNPSCFPYAGHPQAASSFSDDRNGAFCITREGPAQQFTPFLIALVDYYRTKGYIN